MPEPKTQTPAYVPFRTFLTVLDSFRSFLPDQIDTTMWPSYSGGMRSQLIGALKFLRLITESGAPTDALKKVAHADAQHRTTEFAAVLRSAYPALMSLDLTKATPGSFDAEMRKFGQEGETHRKAASFFLQAAKYGGIPLSPLLTKKGSLAGSRRKRVSNGSGNKVKAQLGAALPASGAPIQGSRREIILSGGARMFLSTDTDLFSMTASDRKFVMGMLEKMEEYEQENPPEEADREEKDSE